MLRLRKRQDFLELRDGRRANAATLTLQARQRPPSDSPVFDPPQARVGFTVTKKNGGSVERNRIRRRLREAMRLAATLHVRPGHDYVVIGRRGALDAPFATILNDLKTALGRVHGERAQRSRQAGGGFEEANR